MAGSKRYFGYVDDRNQTFSALLDEGNTEALNGAQGLQILSVYTPPANLQLRTVVFTNSAGTRTIRCVALTQQVFDSVAANLTTTFIPDPLGGSEDLRVAQIIPERLKPFPKVFDSGLNDGDQP